MQRSQAAVICCEEETWHLFHLRRWWASHSVQPSIALTNSKAAIARLKSYTPPPARAWHALPLTRRAAVLILLYAGANGELRVVLTMRAAGLRNYANQAALPGGKSDTLSESPTTVARREAYEEIGLPLDQSPSTTSTSSPPAPFTTTHLTELPTHLARTALAVRPCVALLSSSDADPAPTPRLDAKEVAEVFSAPLRDFLVTEPAPTPRDAGKEEEGEWYKGQWIEWHDTRFRMHSFHVPRTPDNLVVSRPLRSKPRMSPITEPDNNQNLTSPDRGESTDNAKTHNTVFGMTARILIDCARVAYGVPPEFEHSEEMGDEALIGRLMARGALEERNTGSDQRSAGWAWFTTTEDAERRRPRDGGRL